MRLLRTSILRALLLVATKAAWASLPDSTRCLSLVNEGEGIAAVEQVNAIPVLTPQVDLNEKDTMSSTSADQEAEPTSKQPSENVPDDSDDDALMVHVTPADNAITAPVERDRLRSEGQEAYLMSEIPTLIPRREGEAGGDYAKRYSEYMNSLIARGVSILADNVTHNAAPNAFTVDGHTFDVGPHSGITKKEYREFGDWLASEGASYSEVPERFKRFEVAEGTDITY